MSAQTQTTTSADGTTIGYQAYGEGPAIVFVGGATQRKEDWAELAEAMAGSGFRAVTYDRRGRGDSGDTTPYAVEREIEDLGRGDRRERRQRRHPRASPRAALWPTALLRRSLSITTPVDLRDALPRRRRTQTSRRLRRAPPGALRRRPSRRRCSSTS